LGAIAPAVDLTLNGAHDVTVTALLDLDDQLRPSLRADDPIGAQPVRRLKRVHGGLRQRAEDTVHPSGMAMCRN
jgi:hypothetical protein